jgi:hydrogenase maturation protein HypF
MGRFRNKIQIKGIVQGVGFRPTVYNYAVGLGLVGTVLNSASGVFIEVEGEKSKVMEFIHKLRSSPPPLSKITSFASQETALVGESDFSIIKSKRGDEPKDAAISPDIATCSDCVDDILDPENRRHGYPFTNCTNCGPRFTIIKDRPYDRHLTSMADFPMCPHCLSEYEDPSNRRFHAQPNACPVCGPQISLLVKAPHPPLQAAVNGLKSGEIWAIKGLGGFNLACDPFNPNAMRSIREKKNRPTKAFALMAKDLKTVEGVCHVSTEEKKLLTSIVAPIVLLRKKNNQLDHISPDNNYMGIMLPYTPLHKIIFEDFDFLVMTSANLRDEPISSTDDEVLNLIKKDLCKNGLTHNRGILHKCDDSIVMVANDKPLYIRRSRGLVPMGIQVKNSKSSTSLSLGGNMKNCFAIRKENDVFLSQHIGDLLDIRNFNYLKNQAEDFSTLLDVKPQVFNIDAHPSYETSNTEFLTSMGMKEVNKVYHHHAHMLSVMAEHDLLGEKVVGIICDGTGYGPDGTIWGCEFLETGEDYSQFTRVAHLETFQLPGGEKAIHELDRIAIALAHKLNISPKDIPFPSKRVDQIDFLLKRNLNSPTTSSAGRLFDAVSALSGTSLKADYEGQGAILLQKEAELFGDINGFTIEKPWKIEITNDSPKQIALTPLVESIIDSLNLGVSKGEIALKFHDWFARSITKTAIDLNPQMVVLSGGVFQNKLLLNMVTTLLKSNNITFKINEEVPPNDGGIALGQAVIQS